MKLPFPRLLLHSPHLLMSAGGMGKNFAAAGDKETTGNSHAYKIFQKQSVTLRFTGFASVPPALNIPLLHEETA